TAFLRNHLATQPKPKRNPNPPEDHPGDYPQPRNTVPVVNSVGAVVGYAKGFTGPLDDGVSVRQPEACRALAVHNKKGEIVLWKDYPAQPRSRTAKLPQPEVTHLPVINQQGVIVDWYKAPPDAAPIPFIPDWQPITT